MTTVSLSNAARREIAALSPGMLRAFDERWRRHGYHDKVPHLPVDLFNVFRLTPERISTFRCRNGKRSNMEVDYEAFITECQASARPHKNRTQVEENVGAANFLAEAALAGYSQDERKDIAGALWYTSKGITIKGITVTLVKPGYTEKTWRLRGEIKRPGADVMFQNNVILLLNALPQSIVDGMNADMPLPGRVVDIPWSGKERIIEVKTLEGTNGNYTELTFTRHDPWTGDVIEKENADT